MRGNVKVVLELPLLAVVDDINAGIDRCVSNLGEGRHSGSPFCAVPADEVVHGPGKAVGGLGLDRWACPWEGNGQRTTFRLGARQFEDGAGALQAD